MPKPSSKAYNDLAKKVAATNGSKPAPRPRESLWKGPDVDGISYSLLSRFLACRERFRLLVVEGLGEADVFNHKLEYGNMWHVCEEATAAGLSFVLPLTTYCKELVKKYGAQESVNVNKWFRVCKIEYPIYLQYWKENPDVKTRIPIAQEEVFEVPYALPSGRTVILKGKQDSADLIDGAVYIQENKTKGDVNREKIRNELPFDLQTMIYATAASQREFEYKGKPVPFGGVRYNVVRRPLSGQKFNIQQKKGLGKAKKGAETEDEFYERLADLIADPANIEHFFVRFRMELPKHDLEAFQAQCLNPVLEQLCDWWQSIKDDPFNPWLTLAVNLSTTNYSQAGMPDDVPNPYHWRTPYGIWNPTQEGRTSEYDDYIQTGNDRALRKVDTLFSELEG